MTGTLLGRDGVRAVLSHLSPRHRRWRRLLESCDLDPGNLSRPLQSPGPDDFLICGSPRTGTALVAAQLFQPSHVITVMEPWDAMRLPPQELFASLRQEISQTGRLKRGRLDVQALRTSGEVRWQRDGETAFEVDLASRYQLGVKFPAFWRYLEMLPGTRFVVCVRDPTAVVRSYGRSGGRLAEGLDYPIPFNARMNDHLERSTDDPILRRVLMYEYINSRLLPHLDRDEVFVVRYERWFAEPDRLLNELSAFLDVDLRHDNVRLRPPRSNTQPDERIAQLVDQHCPSAIELGYGGGIRGR